MSSLHLTVGPMFAGKSTALLRAVRCAILSGKHPLVVNHALDTRMGMDAVRSHTGDVLPCVQCDGLLSLIDRCVETTRNDIDIEVQVGDVRVSYTKSVGSCCKISVWGTFRESSTRIWAFEAQSPLEVVRKAAQVVDVSQDGLLRLLSDATEVSGTTPSCSDCIFIDEGQFFCDLKEFVTTVLLKSDCHVHVFGLDSDYEGQRFGEILDLVPYCDHIEKLTSVCGICRERPGLLSKRLVGGEGQVQIGQCDYIQTCRHCFTKAISKST